MPSLPPSPAGLYIRFIATMGDMNKALDEYAQLLPDYLDRNPSVTAELLAGLYSSGHYAELVNLSDSLRATGLAQRFDEVTTARLFTDRIKAETKLGNFPEALADIDRALARGVLFLPASCVEIITVGNWGYFEQNIETSEDWRRGDDERRGVVAQYNCAVRALRKFREGGEESSMLNAAVKAGKEEVGGNRMGG